ncbi:MAG: HEAT repeat domain-containing protein [Myxococcota bacterium]
MRSVTAKTFGLFALSAVGCTGVYDCKDDAGACAEMLNAQAQACAEAFKLKHTDRKRKHCEHAIDMVGDEAEKSALPGLQGILAVGESGIPDDNHRQEAAKALGEIGDPAAVEALVSAIDYEAGTSSDPKDKMANRANEAIATSLGTLGDAKAIPKLLELMDRSRDNFVVLKAIRALGQIGDAAAVKDLSKVALEHSNKFMRKNAVIALGDIADPSATDTLIQMMFVEYQGVSFYREASFGLYQIGPSTADALLETMAMKNEAVNQIFEKSGGIKESAVKAKCGFVLGDLRDPRAVEPLMSAFADASDPKSYDPVVLGYAAPPLGALEDAKATSLLQKNMGTIDQSLRDPIMQALVMIGDTAAVPDMMKLMTRADFVAKCTKLGNSAQACIAEKDSRQGAQETAADHVSNMATGEHLDAYVAIMEAEEDPELQKYMKERLVRVETAKACGEDAQCWAKKLSDDDPLLRERSAWALKRLKDPSTMDALVKALSDKNRKARYAAIHAYWSFGDGRAVQAIEKILDDEKSSADFVRVNEDLKRLLVHLQRDANSA